MVSVLCVFLACEVVRKRKTVVLTVELLIDYLCCANVLEDGVKYNTQVYESRLSMQMR